MITNEDIALAVIGVHSCTDGYPNVKYRVKDLQDHYGERLEHIQFQSTNRFYVNRTNFYNKTKTALRFFYSHVRVISALIRHRNTPTVYIPYPAVFAAASLSLFPKILRPKYVVIDAFISLYDTAIIDRAILDQNSVFARLLYLLERLAFRNASIVITDTDANSRHYQQLFGLDINHFKSIPLSTDESDITHNLHSVLDSPVRTAVNVLFVGTLVPLHGIHHILKAIAHLQNMPIEFTIIGDGQTAPVLENHLRDHPNSFHWIRDWQDANAIGNAVANADICLGIFGDTDKAKRVCPFKIYTYTFFGKPVITEQSQWTDDIDEARDSMILIDGSEKDLSIGEAIVNLAESPEKREILGRKSRHFYEKHLSNQHALKQLTTIIDYRQVLNEIYADNK